MTLFARRTCALVMGAVVAGCSQGGSPKDKDAGDAARPERSPTDASTDAGEGGQSVADWALCRQALLGCEDTPPENDPSCPAKIPRDQTSCTKRVACYYCSTPVTEASEQQFASCRDDAQWNVTSVECGS